MRLTLAVIIIIIAAALLIVVVAALSRHKKAAGKDIRLIGQIGQVDTKLNPEGTVIVCGELWRARSIAGADIPPHTRVRVVGSKDHLALVEVCD